MSNTDKLILEAFLDYCRVTASEKKVAIIRRIMIQISDITEKHYNSFDQKTLIDFLKLINHSGKLPATRNEIKKVLKRFLKWKYKDWGNRFDGLRIIRLENDVNHKRLNDKVLLKPSEIESLIRSAETLGRKALIILLFETGGRPEEIYKLRWSDIDFNNGIVHLFSSKTNRPRPIPIRESLIHFKRYKQEYPFPDVSENDFLFPSPRNRREHISGNAISMYIVNLGWKAIGRKIFPYLFRHTRLSPLIQLLSPKVYEAFAGHSIATGKKYYGHLSKDEIHKEILEKVYHIEEIEADKSKVKELEMRVKRLEGTIHQIIDRGNIALDKVCLIR